MWVKILPSAPLTKKAQRASAILPSMFCRFDSCLGHQTILKKFTKAIFFYGFQLHQKIYNQLISIKSFQSNHNITKSFIGLWNILFNLINLSIFLNNKIISTKTIEPEMVTRYCLMSFSIS